MNKHSNLPSGGGQSYVIENVFRALRDLCDKSLSWRERIKNACLNAHRPNDNEFFTGYMSDETLQAWRDCSLGRFGKRFDELDDEEIKGLVSSLQDYIFYASRDKGICESGGDPKAYRPFGEVSEAEGGRVPPKRNKTDPEFMP